MKIFFTNFFIFYLLMLNCIFQHSVYSQNIPIANGFDYPISEDNHEPSNGKGGGYDNQGAYSSLNQNLSNGGWHISSRLGIPRNLGSYYNLHAGDDWNWSGGCDDRGKPVYAIANGLIINISPAHKNYGTGGWKMIVKHQMPNGDIYYSVYMHITNAYDDVGTANSEGDLTTDDENFYIEHNGVYTKVTPNVTAVTRGDIIARVSRGTGCPNANDHEHLTSFGTHFHFELRNSNYDGKDLYQNDVPKTGHYTHCKCASSVNEAPVGTPLNQVAQVISDQIQQAKDYMAADGIILTPYDFIDLNRGCPDSYEPNDSKISAYNGINNATPFNTQKVRYKRSVISHANDIDWFKIETEGKGVLEITLDNLPKNYNLKLYKGAAQNPIDESNQLGSNEEVVTATEDIGNSVSAWYIKVYPNTVGVDFDCSEYRLRVEWTPDNTSPAVPPNPAGYKTILLSGLQLHQTTKELEFIFQGIPCAAGDVPINVDAKVAQIKKLFKQALSIPQNKQWISLDLNNCQTGVCIGDARYSAPFQNTDLIDPFYQADVEMKFDIFTTPIVGIGNNTGTMNDWTNIVANSPYFSQIQASGEYIYPSWVVRAAIMSNNLNYSSQGSNTILINDATMTLDRQVMYTALNLGSSSLPASVKNNLNSLCKNAYKNALLQRLNNGANTLQPMINISAPEYQTIREIYRISAAAHWYKSLSTPLKPFNNLINSESLTGIGRVGSFNKPYWDAQAWQSLNATETYTDYLATNRSMSVWGGVDLSSPTLVNAGSFNPTQIAIDTTCFKNKGYITTGGQTFFYGGVVPNSKPDLVGTITQIGSGFNIQEDTVNIRAIVYNRGNQVTNNVNVRFYEQIGNQNILLGNQNIVFIDTSSYQTTSINWIPLNQGLHKILLSIDGANIIEERNENNNTANDSIFIHSNSPDISIAYPEDGEGLPYQNISLSAYIIDNTMLPIDSINIVWTSNVDGIIGYGYNLEKDSLSIGAHIITLNVTNALGKTASEQISIYAFPQGVPLISITSPTSGSSVSSGVNTLLNAQASDLNDGIISQNIVWKNAIGDTLGYGASLNYTFPAGTHTLTASVTNTSSNTSTATVVINAINGVPVIHIATPANNVAYLQNQSINFTATATDFPDGNIANNIHWTSSIAGNLGTGSSINTALSPGIHKIKALITDSHGQHNQDSINVQIGFTPPTVAISAPTANSTSLYHNNVTLSGTAIDIQDGALTGTHLQWYSSLQGFLGTGNSLTLNTLQYGTHTLSLKATDNDGAFTTVSVQNIYVDAGVPTAAISSPLNNSNHFYANTVTFTGTGTDPQNGALSGASLVWTSSLQGNIGTGNTFTLNNLVTGTHTIRLTVTDNDGFSHYVERTITVIPPHNPQISIVTPLTNSTSLNGQAINLQAIAQDFEEGNLPNHRVSWTSALNGNLGTGLQKTLANLAIGNHTITATAIDTLGATATSSISITILQRKPDATIITPASNLIFAQGSNIAFAGTATDYEDGTLSGAALQWYSVQQGALGSGNNLNVSTLSAGSHEIRLIATDSNNGKDTANLFLIIQGTNNYIQTKFYQNQDSVMKNFGILSQDTIVYVSIPKTAIVSNAQATVQGLAHSFGGAVDMSFNPGTGVNSFVWTTTLQPNGKIIIGGDLTTYNGISRNYIARLNSDGSLDMSFNPGSGASSVIYTTTLQPDGKIIIGGVFLSYNGTNRNCIARLNSDGSLDMSFNPGLGANGVLWATTLQPDGKIIIGGQFTSYNGISRNRIARLNTDGSLDMSFNPGLGANASICTTNLQPDGKIIIGGLFTTYNGTSRIRVARLNSDGSLDMSFNPGSGANDIIRATTLQPDGKIIIGGGFITYNGISCNRIARLNTDGSLDMSFNLGSGANAQILTTTLQPDGKIIIGGQFTSYNGISRNRIARLNTDGSLHMNFNPSSGANDAITISTLQPDGKTIIGGYFTSYNGISRNRIARIQNSIKYSYNPYIDVSNNNTNQWSYTTQYVNTQIVPNFATEINNYLATATPLANGNVLVPIRIHADSAGIIVLKNLNIQYQYADVIAPTLAASISPNPVLKNSNFTISAIASDNINIANVKALINGTLYTMTNTSGNNYSYTVSLSQTGIYPIKITATDMSGLTKDTTIHLTVLDTGKDLVIQNMILSKSNPYTGEIIAVQVVVKNLGNQNCTSASIVLKANGTNASTQTVTVNAGSTINLTFSWAATWGITSLQIAADPSNAIIETNELNNTSTQAIQVLDLTPPTLSNLSVIPNPAFVGQTVQIQTNASDNHGITTVSATLFGQTVNMPFNAGTGKYEGTITANTAGTFTAICTVTDTDGLSTQQTENVTVLNAGIDLSISPLSIVATPSSAGAGQNVSIAYTLQNNGNLTANNAQVAIYLDNQLFSTQTLSLAGNSDSTLSFTWAAVCGNHTWQIVADSAHLIAESNEMNNSATGILQLCLAVPVSIDTVIATPQPDIVGNPLLFQVGVSDALQVDSLCINIASQQICLTWNATNNYFEANFTPSIAGQLPYTLTLTDNNGFVYAYTDSVLVLPLAPNLAFAGVVIPPFIVQNQAFSLTGTVSNVGGSNIQNAKVYFLADGNIRDSALVSINANATTSIATSYSLPYGNHTLAIQLDPQNAISESVEIDNNYQTSISVIDNQAPIFQFIQVSQPLYAGGTMSLEANIWDELPITQANVVFNGNTYPLQIDTLTGNYILSLSSLPQGTYTLHLSATDSSGLIGQTDYPITINNNQPDASVSAIDITYLNSLVSTTDSIQVVIHNNGGSTIASLPVRIKMDGTLIASPAISVAVGQTTTVYTTFSNTLGTHTVSVELDALNSIPESNETNNTASRTVYVWDDTPPSMPILSVNPNTWTTGGSFNLNWTASTDNYGIATYEYKIENGAWQSAGLSLSTSISYTQNGVSNVYLRAKDLAGNVSENSIAQLLIDLVAPTSPLIAEWHCGDIWTTHDSPYYQWLNPGDEGSGINHYEAFIDGTILTIGDSLNYHPTLLSGQHIVQIRGIDNVGNIGAWSNADTVYIDTEIPNAPTMVSLTHPNQNQWYKNDSIGLTITLPSDLSGIEGIHWTISHDSVYTVAPTNYWHQGTTLVIDVLPSMDTIPTRIPDGIWYIHIAAKDGVGHLSQTFTYRVKIDKTAPETYYVVQRTQPIDTLLVCSANFNLVVEDYPMYTTYSTFHSVGNSLNFINGANVSLPTYGLNKIYFYSVDEAGNQEVLDSILVYLAGTDSLNMNAPTLACGPLDGNTFAFKAIAKTNQIDVSWFSSQEANLSLYDLERGTNGTDFTHLTDIHAKGLPSPYLYEDKEVLANHRYFYRLKMIDINGGYKYSSIVDAIIGEANTVVESVYPNPTDDLLNVVMRLSDNSDVDFVLMNTLGQIVVSQKESLQVGANVVELHMKDLSSGSYLLWIKQEGKVIASHTVIKD